MTTPADIYASGTSNLQRALETQLNVNQQRQAAKRQRVQKLVDGLQKSGEMYVQYKTEQENKQDEDAFTGALASNNPSAYLDYVKNTPVTSPEVSRIRAQRALSIIDAGHKAQEFDWQKQEEANRQDTYQFEKKLRPIKEQEANLQLSNEQYKSEEYKSQGALRRQMAEEEFKQTQEKGALLSRNIEETRKQDLSQEYADRVLNDPDNAYIYDPNKTGKDLSVQAFDQALGEGKLHFPSGPIGERAKTLARQRLIDRDKNTLEEMKMVEGIKINKAEKYINSHIDAWHQRGASIASQVYQAALPQLAGSSDITSIQSVGLQLQKKLEDTIANDTSLQDGTDLGMYQGRAKTEALEQGRKEIDRLLYAHINEASREKSPNEQYMQIMSFLDKQHKEGFIDRNGVKRTPPNEWEKDPKKVADYEKAFQDTFAQQLGSLRGEGQMSSTPTNTNTPGVGAPDLSELNKMLEQLNQKYSK